MGEEHVNNILNSAPYERKPCSNDALSDKISPALNTNYRFETPDFILKRR
jgi:hypothetical protein